MPSDTPAPSTTDGTPLHTLYPERKVHYLNAYAEICSDEISMWNNEEVELAGGKTLKLDEAWADHATLERELMEGAR